MEKIQFIRFGGLSPVAQTQYTAGKDKEKTFHNPPRKKGIYCFPWPYIEKFLLGSTNEPGHISNKSSWIKDDDGNLIKSEAACLPYDQWTPGCLDVEYMPWFLKLLKKRKIKLATVDTAVYKVNKEKDEDGDPINVCYMTELKKPRVFKYEGELWHHLVDHVKPGFAIAISGSWVLTDYDVYLEAFKRNKHSHLKGLIKDDMFGPEFIQNHRVWDPLKYHAKDHLEVFIEKL